LGAGGHALSTPSIRRANALICSPTGKHRLQPQRAHIMGWVTDYIEEFHYAAVAFVLFIAGLGVPIPEDIPLIYGGVMAGRGIMNVYVHFCVSMVFILVGDLCLYNIGRRISLNAETPSRWQKLLTPQRQTKVQGLFAKYGSWAVFFGRFIAGVRGAVFLSAGMARFPLGKFIFFDLLAASISVPVWIGMGYWASANWEAISDKAKQYQLLVIGALLVIGVLVIWVVKRRRARQALGDDGS
jgi:membrane protein DedA with SNARE-associated domain